MNNPPNRLALMIIIFVLFVIASIHANAQVKKEPAKKDTVLPYQPAEYNIFLILTPAQVNGLFATISQSQNLTAMDASAILAQINSEVVAQNRSPKKDSITNKHK